MVLQQKKRKSLPDTQPVTFLGQRLFVVTAHPDDESYAAGALCLSNTECGGTTMIACATLGEKGTSHLKRPLTAAALKRRRKQELLAAAKILGAQKVVTLTAPDGGVKKQIPVLYRRYLALARTFKPDAILGFDETGMTGHWDHVAVGRIGLRVAQTLRLPYYAFALPPKLAAQAPTWLKARRRATTYTNTLRYKKPTIRIAIDPTVKKKAIRAHASQTDSPRVYSGYPAWAVKELLRAEYFRKIN